MIKTLVKEDIPQVIFIHRQELKGLFSELGSSFLQEFYKSSLQVKEILTLVEKNNKEVVGFITMVSETRGLYFKILRANFLGVLLSLLGILFTHPFLLITLVKSISYTGFSVGGGEILTLCVEKSYQGKSIGRGLFLSAIQHFRKKDLPSFRISTYDKDSGANKFYIKMGCRLEKQFDFRGERMNYYIYEIV